VTPGKHAFAEYGPELDLEADVCVIGAGAGGASAACAIAEEGLSVIVLEEGRHWAPSDFHASTPWAFRNLYAGRGTRATTGNCVIPMPGGRGVGGSTLINSAICFRTPEAVLTSWRDEHGCEHFTSTWMDACFERIWRTIGVSVNPPEVQRNNNHIFRRGAEALELDGQWMARSAPGCVGCGTCQQGCSTGGKWSIDKTFLAEALAGGRVGVYADCRVDGVETEGDRIVAVTGTTVEPAHYRDGGAFRVRAKRFVLSGGAVGTPRFLLANGLGGGPVGEHLKIHPTAACFGRFETPVVAWEGVTQGYYVDRWKDGFLLQTFSAPLDQLFISAPFGPDESLALAADGRHLAMAGVVAHDEDSVGKITGSMLGYWLGDEDRRRVLAGLRLVARVYFAAGAQYVIPGVHGAPRIASVAEIDTVLHDGIAPWDIGLYASHPMGTCRMGGDPAVTVADATGRVRGVDNLWLSDASVFPTSLGVNPQVTIMAVGLTVGRQVALAS
jgi:choline dehydrogenase-like flavoprotein